MNEIQIAIDMGALAARPDHELVELMEVGRVARIVLARRVNARLDKQARVLQVDINNRQAALEIVKAHKAKQHPTVQKYVDRVIERMEKELRDVSYEQDKLGWSYMAEELMGPATA